MKNETGISPLNELVLVRPDAIAKKNAAGVLTDQKAAKQKPIFGTVLAVGTKPMKEKFFVEPGDRVMYKYYGGDYFDHNREELVLIKEGNLLCKVGD